MLILYEEDTARVVLDDKGKVYVQELHECGDWAPFRYLISHDFESYYTLLTLALENLAAPLTHLTRAEP